MEISNEVRPVRNSILIKFIVSEISKQTYGNF